MNDLRASARAPFEKQPPGCAAAGEPSIRPVAAAIANAIFDATACAACLSRQIGLNRRCPDYRGKRDLNKSPLAMPSLFLFRALKQWQGVQAHLRGP